ncbi:cyclic beta-1,2-glucan synthetase [Pseudorhodobacter antarcticus]|uniref:Cyclic beta-1,2-glucan synthetase n=1 Tax=Pseudorhodobacter antarcticus TaxID=1077947 RepID=A0A1H8H537_9RHOB|nr:cyclic beta-1,2-glucan synthetase [Pseudorhodobacter antarcticus]
MATAYVIAADAFSNAPREGRSSWTWYTGLVGWIYSAGIEDILGLTRNGSDLQLNPCLLKGWPEVTLTLCRATSLCILA